MNPTRPATAVVLASVVATAAAARGPEVPILQFGDPVPRDVRELYDAGVRYLLKTQDSDGSWKDGQQGPGVTGMALMVLLASGEDPNHGPYRESIRRALRSIVAEQQGRTGFLGSGQGHDSMYQHGFGMLALAEAYGAVDDRNLWSDGDLASGPGHGRSLGEALELAARCAVTSGRQNPLGAWRYSPDAKDADTSVSGAVLMGLLAARNAGIELPDETIDRAITYFAGMTGPNGQLGYSGSAGGGSDAVTSIGVLVFAIAGRQALPQYAQALAYLKDRSLSVDQQAMDGYPTYTRYYRAQALFQGDVETWRQWNAGLVRELKAAQGRDGSFSGFGGRGGGFGGTVDTSLALLSLAVNFKFLPVYER